MLRVFAPAAGCAGLILFLAGSAALPQSASDGQSIFRYDTFGDQQLWTETLHIQQAVKTLSPATALSVGLKVDSDALPPPIISAIQAGQVDLNDPAVTIQLLKFNAIVGVIGKVVGANDNLATIGVTCALCHSTVDNSVAPGIGKRLDGWPNRTLNVGAIIALSPVLTDKSPYNGWGAGRYDARFHAFNGTTFIQLNSPSIPVLIPPAYGLQGVGFETYNGDGAISYWNDYVAVTQMGGQGSVSDPRIGVFISEPNELVAPKLAALLQYQLSLKPPSPPAGSFDTAGAQRGAALFNGAARCATCHVPPTYTDVLSGPDPNTPVLHSPSEVGQDATYAVRSATKLYRTTPLRGLWQHPPYFHDGSAADLLAVVNHYNTLFSLDLTDRQKSDLIEYLKSL
jgi:mono/diheme cytochrome c family protein